MSKEVTMRNGEVVDVTAREQAAIDHFKRTGSILPGHADTIAAYRAAGDEEGEADA